MSLITVLLTAVKDSLCSGLLTTSHEGILPETRLFHYELSIKSGECRCHPLLPRRMTEVLEADFLGKRSLANGPEDIMDRLWTGDATSISAGGIHSIPEDSYSSPAGETPGTREVDEEVVLLPSFRAFPRIPRFAIPRDPQTPLSSRMSFSWPLLTPR